MFKKAKCRVKWKGTLGEVIDSEYGVLQGGMLSPKLFTEFLTDLKDYLEAKSGMVIDDTIMTYILYADDLVLCSDSPSGLQTLIDGLFKFCSKWHLIVSLAKTNVLIFGKSKHHEKFLFNNEEIKITDCYKYLGTIISTSSHDIYRKNYPHLAEKAKNAIFALQTYTENNVGHLYPRLAFKMFDVQISPIIEYASEVWFCNKENSELEKIHLGYMKSALKIKSTSSSLALYAECGRFPIFIKQKFQAIKYWQRIIKLDDQHIVKKAYKSLHQLQELGQINWCTHIKNVLSEIECEHIWEEQTLENRGLGMIKEKLYKLHMDVCLENICDSEKNPKLRTYKRFKNEYKFETYLAENKNLNYTLSLLRFRISSHNLRIETGRHTKPHKTPVSERICLYCNEHTVEDESHFIVKCSL